MFGLLEIRKSYSKAAYRLSDRILKLTSVSPIHAIQHEYPFVPTTEKEYRI